MSEDPGRYEAMGWLLGTMAAEHPGLISREAIRAERLAEGEPGAAETAAKLRAWAERFDAHQATHLDVREAVIAQLRDTPAYAAQLDRVAESGVATMLLDLGPLSVMDLRRFVSGVAERMGWVRRP